MNPNQDRADRFDAVVEAYGSDDPCENLIDMMTDAMHWTDDTGRDFEVPHESWPVGKRCKL